MTEEVYRDCPGCGAHLRMIKDAPDPGRRRASPECWALFGELSAYTATRGYDEFIHQLAVDAYGAQHVGPDARPIGVAFALIGLYLACERGYSGRKVQHMHMLLARRSKTWPRFEPPPHAGTVTILDILRAVPGEERDAAIRRWTRSVWEGWSAEQERVREVVARVMADG
jgi:hypothetical protein